MNKYLGFYWTLPALRVGFRGLSKNPDEAAKQSKTIRYQLEMVRRWVKDQGGSLVAEKVFLGTRSDRGSEQLVETVGHLLERCRKEQAKLLLVSFWEVFGWRQHGPLLDLLEADDDSHISLYPAPLVLDEGTSGPGQSFTFDPIEHFRTWRAMEISFSASKPDRKAALAQAIAEIQGNYDTLQELALALNAEGHKSATGKPWTADNLRKFLKTL